MKRVYSHWQQFIPDLDRSQDFCIQLQNTATRWKMVLLKQHFKKVLVQTDGSICLVRLWQQLLASNSNQTRAARRAFFFSPEELWRCGTSNLPRRDASTVWAGVSPSYHLISGSYVEKRSWSFFLSFFFKRIFLTSEKCQNSLAISKTFHVADYFGGRQVICGHDHRPTALNVMRQSFHCCHRNSLLISWGALHQQRHGGAEGPIETIHNPNTAGSVLSRAEDVQPQFQGNKMSELLFVLKKKWMKQ